ncbi:MAG: tetratricopeptide repeat protein [Planctomycetota bacterium]
MGQADDPSNSGLVSSLKAAWHIPLLLGGLGLLVAGVTAAFMTAPEPDFDPSVERAVELIDAERYDDAIDHLNRALFPYLDEGLTPDQRRAFHTLLARSIYLAQQSRGMDLEENHRNILGEYLEAERRNASLEAADVFYLGDTLLRLGRADEAIDRAETLRDREPDRWLELTERVIQRLLDGNTEERARAGDLLARMAMEQGLPVSTRVWIAARQAEMRLAQGYYEETVDQLLRQLPRLRDASEAERAELYLLLGEAYQRLDPPRHDESRANLARAEEALGSGGDPLLARVHLSTARGLIDTAGDDPNTLDDARDRLSVVTQRFAETDQYLPAVLATGELEAMQSNWEGAIEAYTRLVDEMNGGLTGDGMTQESVTEHLMARFRERSGTDAWEDAEQLARLAERLWDVGQAPAAVVVAVARANERLASDLLGDGGLESEGPLTAVSLQELDPTTRREVARRLRTAGAYYREHADKVVLSDNEQFADSLWRAAVAFDRAGERAVAILTLQRFAEAFPQDPRRAEARYRLAQAYQARGEYERAATEYQALLDERNDPVSGKGVGPFADASYVPLAQCYLLDGIAENDGDAEALLRRVVGGELGATRSENFRDALIELGRLYYQIAEFERAIERLEESVERYPEDEQVELLRFLLADAYRLSAGEIDERLTLEEMPDTARARLETERDDRLRRAMVLYGRVRDELETRDPRRRSAAEALNLKHSYFYLGDCAFDLEDFAAAIGHYDTARERFPSDPSSLVALVQIVNAYVELGDMERARTADERARRFFQSLPESALDDPNLPMTRRDWERWLDSSARLYAVESTG